MIRVYTFDFLINYINSTINETITLIETNLNNIIITYFTISIVLITILLMQIIYTTIHKKENNTKTIKPKTKNIPYHYWNTPTTNYTQHIEFGKRTKQ